MKKRIGAAVVALSLVGGASTALGGDSIGQSTAAIGGLPNAQPAAQQESGTLAQAPARGIVGLRSVRRCVYQGTPTTCLVDVHRLRLSDNERRVIAVGTVTPRNVPDARSFGFRSPVRGVDYAPGPFGGDVGSQQLPTCDILRLVLGPLHLDVLGLVIDLNRVVLTITGETGPGNLLGNLLCGLVGLLDGGVVIPRFLAVLTNLLEAITALLRL